MDNTDSFEMVLIVLLLFSAGFLAAFICLY